MNESHICELIVDSVLNYLEKIGIEPKRKSLGGTQRRSISLDISSGKIFYTEGDSQSEEL